MKRVTVMLVLMLASPAAAGTPEEGHRRAYGLIREAKRAEYMKKPGLAWRKYGEARALLEKVRGEHPEWNSEAVAAQLRICSEGTGRTSPPFLRDATSSLDQTKEIAVEMGKIQTRKLAFQKQFDWERKKLDEIESLMIRLGRQENARRILGLQRDAEITQEMIVRAENMSRQDQPAAQLEEEAGSGRARDRDSDGDGLTDAEEARLNTDPLKPDTDGDKLSDEEEVNTYKTDPLNPDTDDDGDEDGWEVQQGYDPLEPKYEE